MKALKTICLIAILLAKDTTVSVLEVANNSLLSEHVTKHQNAGASSDLKYWEARSVTIEGGKIF